MWLGGRRPGSLLPRVAAADDGGVLLRQTGLFGRWRGDDDRAAGLQGIAVFDREEVAVLPALSRVPVKWAVKEKLDHQQGADDDSANGDPPQNRPMQAHFR